MAQPPNFRPLTAVLAKAALETIFQIEKLSAYAGRCVAKSLGEVKIDAIGTMDAPSIERYRTAVQLPKCSLCSLKVSAHRSGWKLDQPAPFSSSSAFHPARFSARSGAFTSISI